MSDPFDEQSAATRLINSALDRSRKKLERIRRAVETSVPPGGELKLKSPHSFAWPDGRKLKFTRLVQRGRHIFLTAGEPEQARIDLMSTADLEALAKHIPGFSFPIENADNVVVFPKNE